jgi:hypothetical protein
MVISYIYSICWCMKSAFYEHQHIPKLKLLLILEQNQTLSNARGSRKYECSPMVRLTKRINEAIPCGPYLSHGALVEFFTLSWMVQRWNLSSVSLLLSLFFKINQREYDTMVPQHYAPGHCFWYVVPHLSSTIVPSHPTLYKLNMWSSWVSRNGATQVIYIATKLKDGPKRVMKTLSIIWKRFLKWYDGGGENGII